MTGTYFRSMLASGATVVAFVAALIVAPGAVATPAPPYGLATQVQLSPGDVRPIDITVYPPTRTAYTANGNGTVSVVDGATNTVTETVDITAPGTPVALDANQDTGYVYVVNDSGALTTLAPDHTITNEVNPKDLDQAYARFQPQDIVVNPDNGHVYVASAADDRVYIFDAAGDFLSTVIAGVGVNEAIPVSVAVDPGRNRIYAYGEQTPYLVVIDGTTDTVQSRNLVIGAQLVQPLGLTVDPSNGLIYIADEVGRQLLVVSPVDFSITATVPNVCNGPDSVAVDPMTETLFVTCIDGGERVIDAATYQTVDRSADDGRYPRAVAVDPTTGLAYTAEFGRNRVEVISSTTVAISGTPPAATVGTPYAYQYRYAGVPLPTIAADGQLPHGLTLSPSGLLSGTPTAGGSFTFDAVATGDQGTASDPSVLEVDEAPSISGAPPNALVGASYRFAFTVDGYPAPTTTVTDGALPTGLGLSSSGVISGVPTAAGDFTATITASNTVDTASTTVMVHIGETVPPAFTSASPPLTATVGSTYRASFTASGAPAPRYQLIGAPAFLTIDSRTGAVSGTPPTAATFHYAVRARNRVGTAVTRRFTVNVAPLPWPSSVTGRPAVSPHSAQGFYVSVVGNTWTVVATRPGGGHRAFTGAITLDSGTAGNVTGIALEPEDSHATTGSGITFRFVDYGDLDGVRFTTPKTTDSVTFDLAIDGTPAGQGQIFTGRARNATASSPVTFTRS